MEMDYLKRLEIECQKLSDAENQIHNYEDYLLQNLQNLEEIKQENQMVSILLFLPLFLLLLIISPAYVYSMCVIKKLLGNLVIKYIF